MRSLSTAKSFFTENYMLQISFILKKNELKHAIFHIISSKKYTYNTLNNKTISRVHNFVDHKVVNSTIKVVSLQTKKD